MAADGRCGPCEDGARLLIAAAVARLAWGLATGRLAADPDSAGLLPWAGLAASCAAPVLTYRLAINLRLTRAAALIAGVLLAVHPALVDAGTLGGPEAFLPALAAAALVAGVYAVQSRRAGPALLALSCAAATAAVERASLPAVSAALNKWSSALAVTPPVGPDARSLLAAVMILLAFAALIGLRAVARGAGGGLALAWLAVTGLFGLWTGASSGAAVPVLAVLAGAGLGALGLPPE